MNSPPAGFALCDLEASSISEQTWQPSYVREDARIALRAVSAERRLFHFWTDSISIALETFDDFGYTFRLALRDSLLYSLRPWTRFNQKIRFPTDSGNIATGLRFASRFL